MTTTLPDLLTPTEAARMLRATPRTLANWRCNQRHPLPYVKPYGRVLYRRRDVERFIAAGEVRPGESDASI